jgi:hypothetical protein
MYVSFALTVALVTGEPATGAGRSLAGYERIVIGLNGVLERGIYPVDVDRLLYERRETESAIVTMAGRITCFVWHTQRGYTSGDFNPKSRATNPNYRR